MRLASLCLVLALAACSGKDEIADQVEERANDRAEAIEDASRSMENALQENILEQQARTAREAGKERADAIRDSDLKTGDLSDAQKNALIEADEGTGPAVPR
jgi:hypothetical protein